MKFIFDCFNSFLIFLYDFSQYHLKNKQRYGKLPNSKDNKKNNTCYQDDEP